MKKTLSVILALVLLMAMCFTAVNVFAEEEVCECGCADCTKVMNSCHCCAACPYLDLSYLLDCAKDETGHYKGSACCDNCKGIWPCDCDCGCQYCAGGDEQAPDPLGPVIPEEQQKTIIQIFQDIMHKLTEVFNNVFGIFFDLLGIKR